MQVTNNFNNYATLNSFNGRNKDKKNTGAGAMFLGYMGGAMTNSFITNAYQASVGNSILRGLTRFRPNPEDNLGNALKQAIKISGLDSKGTELVDIAKMADIEITKPGTLFSTRKTVANQVSDILFDEYKINPLTRKLAEHPAGETVFKNITDKMGPIFADGKNAVYLFGSNKIIINSEKLGFAGFHEMGHAMNRNMSKIGKVLQGMRTPATMIASSLLMLSLFTNKRTEENPPKNKWQKFTNFVKENVGKLTTLCFTPIVAEEIMASVKGQKLAKQVLPKNLMKSVTKTHILGAASYIGLALITGFAAFAANKVRDAIVEKRQAKKAA